MHDVVIIGAGPSGLSALLYAAHYGLKAMCIGDTIGGKLIHATYIIDYPGYEGIKGQEFVNHLKKQVESISVYPVTGQVIQTDIVSETESFTAKIKTGDILTSKTLLFATGNGNKQSQNLGCSLTGGLGIHCVDGFIPVNQRFQTNIKGVYASGDAINYPNSLEQLTTAVSTGAKAVVSIYEDLRNSRPPILWGKSQLPRR